MNQVLIGISLLVLFFLAFTVDYWQRTRRQHRREKQARRALEKQGRPRA